MIIDTHSHLNFNAFKDDADEIISRCLAEQIWMVNVGSQIDTSRRAIQMAEKYSEGVYAAVGLHPIHLESGLVKIKNDSEEIEIKTREEQFDKESYKELCRSKKVVAIGEIGLDYWYRPKTKIRLGEFKQRQLEALEEQVELAEELDLPVIFHCRMAHEELIDFLSGRNSLNNSRELFNGLKGVVHCFTGSWEEAQKYMNMGLHLGFNGIIFKMDLHETIQKMPLEKMLLETDAPYLSPPGFGERNNPGGVKIVAAEIAKIRGEELSEIERKTTENARILFKI